MPSKKYFRMLESEPDGYYIEPIREPFSPLNIGRAVPINQAELPFLYAKRAATVSPKDEFFPEYFLMSKRLGDFLRTNGIDNVELYPAIVEDENAGTSADYFVFNVLGLISCANMELSQSEPFGDAYEFSDLVIDTERCLGLPIFRLAESLNDILVSEKLAASIEAAGFSGVSFRPVRTSDD